jgi:hypothetical protein
MAGEHEPHSAQTAGDPIHAARTEPRAGALACGARIEAVVALGHIDDDRDSARLRDRLKGRHKRRRRDDHLVARLETAGEQG